MQVVTQSCNSTLNYERLYDSFNCTRLLLLCDIPRCAKVRDVVGDVRIDLRLLASHVRTEGVDQGAVIEVDRPDHRAAEASPVRIVLLDLQRLRVVPADPLIIVPRDDLDASHRVEGDCGAVGDDLDNFVGGEHARRAGTLAATSAIAERATRRHAAWV